jgi:hypothetical protein
MRYTRSQIRSAAALFATILSTICAAVLPQIDQLPPEHRFYGTILFILGTAASATVTALNQSLSSEHVSVPVRRARKLGLIEGPKEEAQPPGEGGRSDT